MFNIFKEIKDKVENLSKKQEVVKKWPVNLQRNQIRPLEMKYIIVEVKILMNRLNIIRNVAEKRISTLGNRSKEITQNVIESKYESNFLLYLSWLVILLSYLLSITFLMKDLCDYIGPTWIIQDHLSILKSSN